MNTDDNINKVIQSDLNLDSDNTSDSDEKYDNLYSDPEEAFKFVNLLSQAYNDGKKDINSKTVQDLLDSTNLNTINEDILNDNSSFNEGHYNTNEVMNYNNNNSYNYKKYTHSTDRSNNILNQYKPGPSNNIINKNGIDVLILKYSIETLKRKIQELQSSNDKLKKENKKLTNEKNFKDGEINVIRKRIKTIEQENDDLKKKFINKSKTIEEEKQQERNNYKNEIDRLQTELQFKKQEIEELGISRNHSISKIKETKRNISFPSFNDFPKQPSNNYIPNKASIYTNKSNYLMETESSYQKDVFEIPNNFDDTNIEIKDSPKKNILSKVMTMDISVQTENYDYSNQSSRKVPSKYQIPLPNSRFLFIQRLYNINIYSKLIKYISTENKKQFINTNQNVANPIINKLLSSINDIIANSNIPISNLISPLEEYIGLSLDNNNVFII
ncbi:hypothetical protein BCR36DRAFT_369169 [Piromyces finnis]|uniref:Uncharacterized protein n=1 Tax=Piromyces finnis TaxID=1754191 RepID=A0A1Y1VCV4_9FUNG|nr:hypothetical protein BCR36DRAFT_369169 [Piromyces finnis]|eukprot:ORX52910.1 hypothetical protein BCR36DRAFT_369169 [Piromyces finnis]